MRRSRSSPTRQPPEQPVKWVKPVTAGSSLPYYGCWASSVDYIKSLKTLSERLKSMDMANVADSYTQTMVTEGRPTKDFFERIMNARDQEDAKLARASATSTTAAMELLANALAKNAPKEHHRAPLKTPRSPYESPEALRTGHSPTAGVRHQSLSPSPSIKSPQTPPLPAVKYSGIVSTDNLVQALDTRGSPLYQLESDPPVRGFSAQSGSSNFSHNFSASECSMYYSPSHFSGISSLDVSTATDQSVMSGSKLPSVCMMAEYSAANYQNRRVGTSARLRAMRNTDNVIETSGKQLHIEKNGASRSCMLASQTRHSGLRSACPPGTVIANDDLAKYRRLRNCNPNLASRELGFAFHTTLVVQAAMRKHHGE